MEDPLEHVGGGHQTYYPKGDEGLARGGVLWVGEWE